MGGVRSSVILMTVQRYYTMVLNFFTLAVVSRLLRPEEVGVALTGSLIALMALSLRDFASNNFLVQKPDLTQEDRRAAFSVLALITLITVATLALAAPWIAQAYGEPILVPYLRLVCVCAGVELMVLPVLGLLQREMAFGRVAVVTTIQVTSGAIITLACAAAGFSSMSFAWAWFASSVSAAVASLYLWKDRSIFRPIAKGWRAVLTFGGYYGVNQMLARVYETVPSLILGRAISMGAVGYYNRALQVCQLPDKVFLSGAMAVAVPAFSARARENSSLREPYLRGISYITALHWPALTCTAILAHPIVDVLLGSQWQETAPIIQIMAIAYLSAFAFLMSYSVLVALGAMRDLFLRALVLWPVSATIVSVGAWFSLTAMALCMLIALPFQAYVTITAVRKHIELSWADIFLALKKSFIVTLFSAAGPIAVVASGGFDMDLSVLSGVIAGLLAAPGWVMGLWLMKHPLWEELMRGAEFVRTTPVVRRVYGRLAHSGLLRFIGN
jgi:O-antigen/teichoic acid export membrane protein